MTYRVRFAPVKKNAPCLPSNVTVAAAPPPTNTKVTSQGSRGKFKSRTGCYECKRRRVKCDETFPVCLRCQRSQSVCRAVPRMTKWQTELPWLNKPNNPSVSLPNMSRHINKRLLQHWLEKTSQIMVLDPDDNPMSFPILAYLDMSPALVHALQSISAAHENFFDPSKLTVCLEERSQALSRFKEELQNGKELLPSSFLTIFLLGISSPWIENNLVEFGKEHLFGARAIIELLLSNDNSKKDPFTSFLVGVYIYWDMVTSFLVDPDEQQPLNTSLLFEAVQDMRSSHHPIIGYSVEILYLLGTLGRYCRQVLDGTERDFFLEATLEEQMLEWECMQDGSYFENLSNAFRKHGLTMLYRICGRTKTNTVVEQAVGLSFEERTNEIIRQYALDIVKELSQVPMSSSHLNLQGIPLFTAGSELYADDIDQRIEVTQRFKALYSMNRLPMNLLAIRVLENIWHLRDASMPVSWMEFMLQRKWRLMLG